MKKFLSALTTATALGLTAFAQNQSPAPVYPPNQTNNRAIGEDDSSRSSVLGGILRAVTGEQDTSSISLDQLTRNWNADARQAAQQMYQKYGAPAEVSNERIVWRNVGNVRSIEVRNQEVQHHFPYPHQDVVRHTIALNVPPEKIAELAQFSGSLIVDRTAGELSARCNTEESNLIALNLANDIVTGRLSADQARSRFTELAQATQQGQRPSYATGLQFSATSANTAFPDGPGAAQNQQGWQRIGW
ncbi:MAG: hypothetical protein C0518_05665 [Opitutus sp.]|nr:hypothetical protein [Opitutus sp.]